MNDDLPEGVMQLTLQRYCRTLLQANLGDYGFDRFFQNGSFQF
jgi:hypothetical protein